MLAYMGLFLFVYVLLCMCGIGFKAVYDVLFLH